VPLGSYDDAIALVVSVDLDRLVAMLEDRHARPPSGLCLRYPVRSDVSR
jgi:hypothetical protein